MNLGPQNKKKYFCFYGGSQYNNGIIMREDTMRLIKGKVESRDWIHMAISHRKPGSIKS